jgi:hypothetical protein
MKGNLGPLNNGELCFKLVKQSVAIVIVPKKQKTKLQMKSYNFKKLQNKAHL